MPDPPLEASPAIATMLSVLENSATTGFIATETDPVSNQSPSPFTIVTTCLVLLVAAVSMGIAIMQYSKAIRHAKQQRHLTSLLEMTVGGMQAGVEV